MCQKHPSAAISTQSKFIKCITVSKMANPSMEFDGKIEARREKQCLDE